MQVKKTSSSGLIYRANRQLVQANRQAIKQGQVSSNKDLIQAASKIQVTRKDPVKAAAVPTSERIPTSPTPEEQAAKVFSVSYLEQQQRNGGESVSCFRSTGSVNIPTCRCSTIIESTAPKPPKPRRVSMPVQPLLQIAEQPEVQIWRDENCSAIPDMVSAVRTQPQDMDIFYSNALVRDPPVVAKAPPERKTKANDCKKHSKCHCALFSQKVAGFFDVSR